MPAPMQITPTLKCILCYNHPQAPGLESVAVFVVNGLSVCMPHSDIAKRAVNFNHAWELLVQDYAKKAA